MRPIPPLRFLLAPWPVLLAASSLGQPAPPPMQVLDRWGRPVTDRGITLLDWEGPIANPRVKLTVVLPEGMATPATLNVGGTNPRLHFDRSNAEDLYGIGKRIAIPQATKSVELYVAIFPDRDAKDERHELVFQLFGPDRQEKGRLRMPIAVIDQDQPGTKGGYPIHLDYSKDRTGFFRNPEVRRVVRQAADDWSYFLDDQGLDEVRAGEEQTPIWEPSGFVTSRPVRNARPYRGFLLYMVGIHHDEMRAGGSPSLIGKAQTSHGRELPIRRSGSVEMDVAGNWNRLGWFLTRGDEDWWFSGSMRSEQSDFYSIALHEMGHALAFQETYPLFKRAKQGTLADEAVQAYLGKVPRVDASEHFPGTVDPVSGYGAFGMEYLGPMKERRWLITKAHLLLMQAIGYKLRKTSALDRFAALTRISEARRVGEPIALRVPVSGGVPGYRFTLKSGALPPGVTLNEFDGTLLGRSGQPGVYEAVVQVEDNDPTSTPTQTSLRIEVRA